MDIISETLKEAIEDLMKDTRDFLSLDAEPTDEECQDYAAKRLQHWISEGALSIVEPDFETNTDSIPY